MYPEGSQKLATWDWWIILRCVTMDVAASRSYPMAGFVMDDTETDGGVETEHLEHNINVSYCCRLTRTTLDLDSVCKAPNLCDSLAEKACRYCQYNISIAVHQSPYVWFSVQTNFYWNATFTCRKCTTVRLPLPPPPTLPPALTKSKSSMWVDNRKQLLSGWPVPQICTATPNTKPERVTSQHCYATFLHFIYKKVYWSHNVTARLWPGTKVKVLGSSFLNNSIL